MIAARPWLLALVASVGCGAATSATNDGGAGATGEAGVGGGHAGATSTAGAGGGGAGGQAGASGAGGHAGAGGAGGHAGTGGASGAVGTTLPACPGVPPLAAGVKTCRTSADCGSPAFMICAYDYRPAGCGACFMAPRECNADGDCGTGRICGPSGVAGPCVCGLPGTMCAAACTATSCLANDQCDANTGRCAPKSCKAGATCVAGTVCAPERAGASAYGCVLATCATDGYACPADTECKAAVGADAHGCSPVSCVGGAYKCPANSDCKAGSTSPHQCQVRACTSDAVCDCGACVMGTCQSRLFICSPVGAA